MQEEIKIDLCKEENIINHYVAFTKIYNEQAKLHGRTREAVLETIHICKSQNVMSEYLSSREKEVADILDASVKEVEQWLGFVRA